MPTQEISDSKNGLRGYPYRNHELLHCGVLVNHLNKVLREMRNKEN